MPLDELAPNPVYVHQSEVLCLPCFASLPESLAAVRSKMS